MEPAEEAGAFSAALAPHYGDVARYCRALCAGWEAADAEDALQQALLTALEHRAQLRDPARFRPWLFRIVTRTYDAAARRRFWRRFVPLADVAERDMPAVYTRGATDADDVSDVLAALGRLADQTHRAGQGAPGQAARRRPVPAWTLPITGAPPVFGAALVLLLTIACVLPVPQEETLGQLLRVRARGSVADARARLAGLPWTRRGLLFTAGAPDDAASTLLVVAPRASAAEVARWVQDLAARTGGGTVTAEPLHDVVRRPAVAAAARAVLGARGATPPIGDAELEVRIRARLGALSPGGIAVRTDGRGGARSLVVVPQLTAGPPDRTPALGVYVAGTRHLVLWMLRRRPDGSGADTIRLALDSVVPETARGPARQALVERALRARGITHVRVEFVNGGVWVRTEPGRP